ncbi:MAG: ABC transporter ATP-binding protein [Candidatus Zixiibacteriota bacterium]|nr:MAG: ABC transporter ATP-binding protein [candidate division Zixibacteria bacterium]
MIQIEQIGKSYDGGRTWAVRDVSLGIERGELVVLLGASGCGKTSTLKMINRLIEPTVGSIRVDGSDIKAVDPVMLRRSIGYVFQGVGLFPHYRVGENVAAVLRLCGWERERSSRRVEELLSLVGLPAAQFRDRFPHELSGGQRQRVGVARALAAEPKVMLMDEPFGALDPITRDRLQLEFTQLHRRLGLTVLMVTHDMTEALLMADRVAVMDHGRILQIGTPHQLLNQAEHEVVSALMETPKRQADRLEALARGEEDSL